ncbi:MULTISPECIES: RES family NAD+ phosphorylase [unclassified Vibrio]|uniref:RES family NAD+ phosphorylase n=1 Tax=unclassified Vibrio TaxID=2614977 RepID=UPI00113FDE62|nr:MULTISPECIES: RES family NAD+ phosphorylase [unclassified Vibrio]
MILFKTMRADLTDPSKLLDYEKTSSFKYGARWNSQGTGALYFSSNVQNAMLELANYVDSPKMANVSSVVAVYELSDSVALHEIIPNQLNDDWNTYPYPAQLQLFGDSLLKNPYIDGIIAPSISINDDIARSKFNAIRRSCYANIILDPTSSVMNTIRLIDTVKPIYSDRMFGLT